MKTYLKYVVPYIFVIIFGFVGFTAYGKQSLLNMENTVSPIIHKAVKGLKL